ncbi:MAG: hypothetical protein AAB900_00020 [Patescibacteria group bacterium]
MASSKKEILAAGKKRERRRLTTFLILTLIFLVIISVDIIFLLRSPGFLINKVVISGASPYEQEKITEAVNLVLNTDCPCLIPRRSLLFYPRSLLSQAVHQASPRAGDLELSLFGRTLELNIQERKPLALWCGNANETKQCFFLDQTGTAFSPAPTFSTGVFPEFYQATGTPTLFSQPRPELDLPQFLNFTNQVGVLLQTLSSSSLVRIEAETDGDLALIFEQGRQTWKLLINEQTKSDLVLANLKAVLQAVSFRQTWQAGQNLDYLDLRFSSKVFYKFRSTSTENLL